MLTKEASYRARTSRANLIRCFLRQHGKREGILQMRSLKERTEDFDDTVDLCGIDIDGPVELLDLLYEDFAVSTGTFFHPSNLDILLQAGIISEEIKIICINIEAQVCYLTQNPSLVQNIRGNAKWEAIFALCKQVQQLKSALTKPK
jgi:hypothetical protein